MGERSVAVVIEDDQAIRAALAEVLRRCGFAVHPAASAAEGLALVMDRQPDIVTVDIGLPDYDGIELSRRIRMFTDAYVMIISSRADEADALLGFEAGADDYLIKPFRPQELAARVRAMFRRPRIMETSGRLQPLPSLPGHSYPEDAVPAAGDSGWNDVAGYPLAPQGHIDFSHRGLTLHEATRQAAVDGTPVSLTRSQFDILLVLMENGRTIQTKADLVRRLRNEPYHTGSFVSAKEERAVEVQVSNLRKRLGETTRRPRWIETVHGVGYRMTL